MNDNENHHSILDVKEDEGEHVQEEDRYDASPMIVPALNMTLVERTPPSTFDASMMYQSPFARQGRAWRSYSMFHGSTQSLPGSDFFNKISRSSSLTSSTDKMDTLQIPTDFRRQSSASDCSSSSVDNWDLSPSPVCGQERRVSSTCNQLGILLEDYQDTDSVSSYGLFSRMKTSSSLSGGHSLSYFSPSEERRSSGGLSERSSFSRLSTDFDRRNSSISITSDRRSSGYTSDQPFDPEKRLLMKTDSNQSDDAQSKVTISTNNNPGMGSVPDWLKFHRLHKYSPIIMSMTYEEMLQIKEDNLISLGITKGAARKLAKIIAFLHERQQILAEINGKLNQGTEVDVRRYLCDIEDIVKSPVLLEKDSELMDQIVSSLTNICSHLLLSPSTDGRTANHFVCILDTCLSSPNYSPQQKQLYSSWKQKIRAIWSVSSFPHTPLNYHDSSGLYSSRYVPRRYSLHNQSPMIRQISPVRLTNNHQQAKFFHRSSVPNIKFGYPGMPAASPNTRSCLRDDKSLESNEPLDNIETQLENICLSVTNQVIDKEEY